MTTAVEIAHYWAWHLERAKVLGLAAQLLALFFFIALWWNQDRGWRAARWPLVVYFASLGLIRYSFWLSYGIMSTSPTPAMRAFIVRSGAVGLAICIAMIIFLILDRSRRWVSFPDFGPEARDARRPTISQWVGLVVAVAALWAPFVPHPARAGATLITNGFPSSFGVTITPTLLYLLGLMAAGSRKPRAIPMVWLGLEVAIGSLGSEPWTVHGLVAAVLGILAGVIGLSLGRDSSGRINHPGQKSGTM